MKESINRKDEVSYRLYLTFTAVTALDVEHSWNAAQLILHTNIDRQSVLPQRCAWLDKIEDSAGNTVAFSEI